MIDEAVKNYGKKLGIEALAPSDEGVVHMSVENLGDLYLEDNAESMVVYVKQELEEVDEAILHKAMQLCHYKQGNPMAVRVGMYEDNGLIFLIRLEHHEIDDIQIEKAVELLGKIHRQVLAE